MSEWQSGTGECYVTLGGHVCVTCLCLDSTRLQLLVRLFVGVL